MNMKNILSEAETKKLLEAPITVDELAERRRPVRSLCQLALAQTPQRRESKRQQRQRTCDHCRGFGNWGRYDISGDECSAHLKIGLNIPHRSGSGNALRDP